MPEQRGGSARRLCRRAGKAMTIGKAAGIAAAVALALSAGGCASIISGQHDQVKIESEPPGQSCEVYQGGETVARVITPQTVTVERNSSGLLVVCGDAREREESGFNAWTFGNFIFFPIGTIIGLAVDWGTGADHGYGDVMVRGAAPGGGRG